MPENTVYVGRGSKFGNPFTVEEYGREAAVSKFRSRVTEMIASGSIDINELKGKDLACWCKENQKCHADVLLELLK